MGNQYNILVDFVGVILIMSILFSEHRQKKRAKGMESKLLFALLICCTAIFLADIPGLIFDGLLFSGVRIILWILDTLYWILQIVYCWLWLIFADYWAFHSLKRIKKMAIIYAVPMLFEVFILLININSGWIFTLNELNTYERGDYYLPNIFIYVLYIGVALIITILGYVVCKEAEQKRRKVYFAIYMFLPSCGVVLDMFVYGISWIWPMAALSLLMIYLNIQQQYMVEEQLEAARLETELTESRISVMLSQIQPHFLFNVLSVIYHLCDKNPEAAKKATGDFSKYLRMNLDSLKLEAPVPFDTELQHVQLYLSLEKMRFEEKLNIIYDIQITDFLIPALTVQPMVENAVKYGVGKSRNGGTVTIVTRDCNENIKVIVSDNGVGFDPYETQEDGRTHIGIDNVRKRLWAMSKGTMEIQSKKDVGTTVTLTIPRQDNIK